MNSRTLVALCVNLAIAAPVFSEDDGHGKQEGEASEIVELTAEEQRAAGVVVDPRFTKGVGRDRSRARERGDQYV